MANLGAKPELRSVTITVVPSRAEGQDIQKKLRSQAIESFLSAERSYVLGRSGRKERGAIKVQVARSDVERAIKVLATRERESGGNGGHAVVRQNVERRGVHPLRSYETVPMLVIVSVIFIALMLFLF